MKFCIFEKFIKYKNEVFLFNLFAFLLCLKYRKIDNKIEINKISSGISGTPINHFVVKYKWDVSY